jgi:hypothetical protein
MKCHVEMDLEMQIPTAHSGNHQIVVQCHVKSLAVMASLGSHAIASSALQVRLLGQARMQWEHAHECLAAAHMSRILGHIASVHLATQVQFHGQVHNTKAIAQASVGSVL